MYRGVIVLFVLAFLIPMGVSAQDYYVSPSGTGTTCSESSPCTLGEANSRVQPGEVVALMGGTYSESVNPAVTGNPYNPTTYQEHSGDAEVFGIYSTGFDYVLVNGLSTMNIYQNSGVAANTRITWEFNDYYEVGQYANGDFFAVGPITITGISPPYSSGRNGCEVNPNQFVNQPFDNRAYSVNYDSSLNCQLPLTISSGPTSVVKGVSRSACDTSNRICLQFYAVLTVVDSAPSNPSNTFRPPWFGGTKPTTEFLVSNLDFSKIPSLPRNDPNYDCCDRAPSIDDVAVRFRHAQIGQHIFNHNNQRISAWENLNFQGTANSYHVYIARFNAVGLLRLLLDDLDWSNPEHKNAMIYYIQDGIDMYWIVSSGLRWSNHNMGRKILPTTAGYLLDDDDIKFWAGASDPPYYGETATAYYSQKADDGQGKALWGRPGDENDYWTLIETAGNTGYRWNGDPYGYIDDSFAVGDNRRYQYCCSSNGMKYESLAVRLLGAESVFNHDAFHEYTDRWYSYGYISQPDPCAPMTGVCAGSDVGAYCNSAGTIPDECSGDRFCNSFCGGGSGWCDYSARRSQDFGVLYGPAEGNAQDCHLTRTCDCIRDEDPSDGIGRFPNADNAYADGGFDKYNFGEDMWDAFHECEKADTCPGLVSNNCTQHSDCDDGNICTLNTCDTLSGVCNLPVNTNEGQVCSDDGSWCTGQETCQAGSCVHEFPGGNRDCSNPRPYCEESSQSCVACSNPSHCDDNKECTTDSCVSGSCNNTNRNEGDSCSGGVCDNLGNCVECNQPSDCQDISCNTKDCSSQTCEYAAITDCSNDDGCCPGGCTESNDNDCVAFPQDYVSWWKFEDGAGATSFADESGTNPGTCIGSACPTFITGLDGGAYQFDGVDDYIEFGTSTFGADTTNEFTLSLWINLLSDVQGIDEAIVTRGRYAYYFRVRLNSDNTLDVGTRLDGVEYHDSNAALVEGVWHHLAINYKDGVREIYIDGNLDASTDTPTGTLNVGSSTQTTYLGAVDNDEWFSNAVYDNLMVYDRGLSGGEISQIYCSQGGSGCETTECNTNADQSLCDGCVDFSEIRDYIDRWYASIQDVSMVELVRALEAWKAPCIPN
jgi:hypothetical protein